MKELGPNFKDKVVLLPVKDSGALVHSSVVNIEKLSPVKNDGNNDIFTVLLPTTHDIQEESEVYSDTVVPGSYNGIPYSRCPSTVLSSASSTTEPSLKVASSLSIDPWVLAEVDTEDDGPKWKDLTWSQRIRLVIFGYLLKLALLLALLFTFVCSLDLLGSALRLVGGRAAGQVFRDSQLLRNPMAGLMIGVLATVLVQSSSTSTSIVVSLVASEILDVPTSIPIIMGANIGTSLTNTLVSVAHSSDRQEFRRAFAGATVHDMFNWLTVIVLLPLEVTTGYMFKASSAIIKAMDLSGQHSQPPQLLTLLTEPVTGRIVQLNKHRIEEIASGSDSPSDQDQSIMKKFCGISISNNATVDLALGSGSVKNGTMFNVVTIVEEKMLCDHLFAHLGLTDSASGAILLIISLAVLIGCLVCIVKLLHSVLHGPVAGVIRKTVNSDLPGCWSFLTGYVAILIGALLTILVQSSSVFTSSLTPLVGIGVLDITRMYPLTLGSNVGTTFTSVLAAMASPPSTLPSALQVALCHLLFNASGIALFYPLPWLRRWPIGAAKFLGKQTARYRWFAILYVVISFFLLPALILGLSLAGSIALISVGSILAVMISLILALNCLQRYHTDRLPDSIRDWSFLPECMRSLEPMDRVVQSVVETTSNIFRSFDSNQPKANSSSGQLPTSESCRKLLLQRRSSSSSTVNQSCQNLSRATSCSGSPRIVIRKQLSEIEELSEHQITINNNNKSTILKIEQ